MTALIITTAVTGTRCLRWPVPDPRVAGCSGTVPLLLAAFALKASCNGGVKEVQRHANLFQVASSALLVPALHQVSAASSCPAPFATCC